MATDVKLDQGVDGSFLVLEGRVVKAAASDFMLDSPERRMGPNPFRRALVHDQSDGLTINFANDYKGGITLNAVREISPIPVPTKGLGVPTNPTPILVVRGGIEFEFHSTPKVLVGGGGESKVTRFSLHEELTKLQDKISTLEAKVAALEAKK